MSQPESKAATEQVRPIHAGSALAGSLAEQIEFAATESRSPREYLERIAPLIRAHFGSWFVIATMPHRSALMAIDSSENGSVIDPELIRLQLQRAAGASTATTIRLADGRGARSLQVCVGEGAAAVGIGIVHLPERTPDAVSQLDQLRTLATATDAAFRVIHSLDQPSQSLASESVCDSSRLRLREFHRSLNMTETAMSIASESTWLVDCDRVCVLLRDGSRFRLQAVTGVDVVDRRGNEVKCLEALAARAVAIQKSLVYPALEELPPQIDLPLAEYLDQSLVQSGVLVSIHPSNDLDKFRQKDVIAAIVFERFRGQPIVGLTPAMRAVCDEALIALENSQAYQSIFLLPVWETVGKLLAPATRYKTVAAVMAIATLLIASLIVQVDYKVTATGSMEPATVRNLFASADGVVTKLHVNDGDFVANGDILVEIENAELQRQTEEIAGEIRTTTEKLSAVDAVLVAGSRAIQTAPVGEQMTIERRQLQTQLESLKAQQVVIFAEQERQTIHSPIAGQVIGWRLSQRLEQRPVSRGHRLFSVVDTAGPKVLKLQVPDRDSGTVLEHAKAGLPLQIDFVLATEPDRTLRGELIEVASAARMDAQGINQLDVLATVSADQELAANMGAEVTAGIHCGRRSILATWFGDVTNFYHRHIRFYFA